MCGSLYKLSDLGVLLATFLVEEPQDTSIITKEIPQALMQAVLAFQEDPALETHTAFVLRGEGTKLQLSSASISRAHIHSLSQGNPLDMGLTLLGSVAYDLREPDERRECLRIFIGLLRRLANG